MCWKNYLLLANFLLLIAMVSLNVFASASLACATQEMAQLKSNRPFLASYSIYRYSRTIGMCAAVPNNASARSFINHITMRMRRRRTRIGGANRFECLLIIYIYTQRLARTINQFTVYAPAPIPTYIISASSSFWLDQFKIHEGRHIASPARGTLYSIPLMCLHAFAFD